MVLQIRAGAAPFTVWKMCLTLGWSFKINRLHVLLACWTPQMTQKIRYFWCLIIVSFRGVPLTIHDEIAAFYARNGFGPVLGARPRTVPVFTGCLLVPLPNIETRHRYLSTTTSTT